MAWRPFRRAPATSSPSSTTWGAPGLRPRVRRMCPASLRSTRTTRSGAGVSGCVTGNRFPRPGTGVRGCTRIGSFGKRSPLGAIWRSGGRWCGCGGRKTRCGGRGRRGSSGNWSAGAGGSGARSYARQDQGRARLAETWRGRWGRLRMWREGRKPLRELTAHLRGRPEALRAVPGGSGAAVPAGAVEAGKTAPQGGGGDRETGGGALPEIVAAPGEMGSGAGGAGPASPGHDRADGRVGAGSGAGGRRRAGVPEAAQAEQQRRVAAERAAEIARRQERQRLDRGRDFGPSR